MGRPSDGQGHRERVLYLTDAATVTGQILYVDGGAHFAAVKGRSDPTPCSNSPETN